MRPSPTSEGLRDGSCIRPAFGKFYVECLFAAEYEFVFPSIFWMMFLTSSGVTLRDLAFTIVFSQVFDIQLQS